MTRQFGGLGLGLAISKHLVELHRGTIQAESRGRSFGSTFKITLETYSPESAKADVAPQSARGPAVPLRILIVEDHRDTRRTLSRLLTHFGHEVLAADNVHRALEIIDSATSMCCYATLACPMEAVMK